MIWIQQSSILIVNLWLRLLIRRVVKKRLLDDDSRYRQTLDFDEKFTGFNFVM